MLSKSLKIFAFFILLMSANGMQTAFAGDVWQTTKEIGISTAIGAVAGEFVHAPFVGAALGGGLALATQMWNKMTDISNVDTSVEGASIQTMKLDDELILIVPTDVLFEINSADFRPGSTRVLDDLTGILSQYPKENIHISANLDPIMTHLKWHNDSLSNQQAEQVAGYFWMNGIRGNAHRLLSYCGDEDRYPIASNKLLAGMTKNRRIQIIVYTHQLSDYPKSAPSKTEWTSWNDSEGADVEVVNHS